ncbi:hypothetical protein ACIRPQ_08040 [Streptomyces sp. NPDC101213]|uniref:hypothetical protein n=1 Tax=Streptomyces sp. NPDC101213 TaxID=3366130 RepID=UPI0038020E15
MTPVAAVAKAAKNSEGITSLRYRVTGTVPEKGHLRAEASMSTDPLTMSMKMTAPGRDRDGRLEIRFVDEVMYVGGSAVDSGKLQGKSWFRAEPAVWGRGAADNRSYGVLPRQIEGNPIVQSTLLTGSTDLRMIETETIDGTRTTHDRGTVTGDGLRAAREAAADETSRERRIEGLDQFMGLGVSDTLTMDLWIDGDDRAKQFRMRAAPGDTMGGVGGGPLDLTVTFLDIDQPVAVKTPPAEDTAALADDTLKS